MAHEIKIGGVSLWIDDPQGQLARVTEAERTLEHLPAEGLETSVRTASNRPAITMVNTVDPFGSIHARTHLFDKVVNGKQGFASLALAWMLFGLPLATFAMGIGFTLVDGWHRLAGSQSWRLAVGVMVELAVLLILGLLMCRTVRVARERKQAKRAQAHRPPA